MDLVADQLLEHLPRQESEPAIEPRLLRPAMRRRFSRPGDGGGRGFTLDRLLNRFFDVPRWIRREGQGLDIYHLVDHSYSQLVFELPARQTVVTCHDLDTFRCLLDPPAEPRGLLFRAMVRRILKGFRAAAHVACPSAATRDAVLAAGLHPPERVSVVPNGVHPTCSPDPDPEADRRLADLLGPPSAGVELLHVGSTVDRKRIDVALRVVAAVRERVPGLRLLRVGGPLTAPQRHLAETLGLGEALVELPFLERRELAAAYRRATVVLQPSAREGFGLPVAEAMACGTPVLASDLPVLREVGGEGAIYRPVGDVEAWRDALDALLTECVRDSEAWGERRRRAIAAASPLSWNRYAGRMAAVYCQVRRARHDGAVG